MRLVTMDKPREEWGTRIGFILAAVGSAVGLGNMWRFPYLTAESGGASFVLLYIVLLFLIGMPVMLAEFVIGRGGQKSPVQAMAQPGEANWSVLGLLFVFTGFWILAYYSVIAGWTIKYMVDSLSGVLVTTPPGEFFKSIQSGPSALYFHLLFMGITTFVVASGIKRGIETTVKILIPLLFAMVIGIAIWAFFQEGAGEGYLYYLQPNFEKLFQTYSLGGIALPFFNLEILAAAAGQTFFTLSLGMGAMITYSSYLSKQEDLVTETLVISGANFSIAFLAGLMVFPIIYSFGLQDEVAESTVATLFIAIPQAFHEIANGRILSFVFFTTLMLAALTSAISLLEVVTSASVDQLPVSRRPAAIMSGILIFVFGILPATDPTILNLMDKIATNLLLMSGGLLLGIYVGWIMNSAREEVRRGLRWNVIDGWCIILRWVVPPALFALLVKSAYDLVHQIG